MKKILLVLFLYGCACQEQNSLSHSTQVSVITDCTDPHALLPVAEPLLGLYEFEKDKDREARFRICSVTDKQLNPASEVHLPDAETTDRNNSLDEPYYREKHILAFYDDIRKMLSHFTTVPSSDSSLKHSEIFYSVAHELQLLEKSQADRRILLVFSDLQENSLVFNSYSIAGREQLRKRPMDIVNIFRDTQLLPDSLTGITIFFVFQPKSRDEDQVYGAMTGVYTRLLEERGAKITIQATNTNYAL